jgi:hypothetical protein
MEQGNGELNGRFTADGWLAVNVCWLGVDEDGILVFAGGSSSNRKGRRDAQLHLDGGGELPWSGSLGGNCRIRQPCQVEAENLRAARLLAARSPAAKRSSGRGAVASARLPGSKCNLGLERCIVKLFL